MKVNFIFKKSNLGNETLLVTLRIKTKTYVYLHNDDNTCHCLMPHQGDISRWLPHFYDLIGPTYTLTTTSFYCLYWPTLVSSGRMQSR